MEDTIDLRPYLTALFRYWWLILGVVILTSLLSVLYYNSRDVYRATAWVAISMPSQRMQFDDRIESTVESDLLLAAYPELAMTDEVLSKFLPQVSARTNGEISTLSQLSSLLSADVGDAPRLMKLTVRYTDSEIAAELANLWADNFADAVNNIYRNPGGQVEFYEGQLAISISELRAAEDDLVAFQARNRQALAKNELDNLLLLQLRYLADQSNLRLLLSDIETLRSQLVANSLPAVTFADQLTAMTLQLNAYGAATRPGTSTSSQFQIQLPATGDLTTSDRATQLQFLDELTQAVENSLAAAGSQLPDLESRIYSAQTEFQTATNELDRLTRQRDLAQETYQILARKLDEVRVSSQDEGSNVQIASRAIPPTQPDRPNPILLFGAAIFLGLFASIAVIVALTWWRGRATTSA